MSSVTPCFRVVNMDHCAFNPTIGSWIPAAYTGLALFAQNNFFLESSRSVQLNPVAQVKEGLSPDFFWIDWKWSGIWKYVFRWLSSSFTCGVVSLQRRFASWFKVFPQKVAKYLKRILDHHKHCLWWAQKSSEDIFSNTNRVTSFSASYGIYIASDGTYKDGSIRSFMHGETKNSKIEVSWNFPDQNIFI